MGGGGLCGRGGVRGRGVRLDGGLDRRSVSAQPRSPGPGPQTDCRAERYTYARLADGRTTAERAQR